MRALLVLLAISIPIVVEPICYPVCQSIDVVRHGKVDAGNQRYKCRNRDCSRHSFILKYSYRGYLADVKERIIDMPMNGSAEVCLGIRKRSVEERIPQAVLPKTEQAAAESFLRWKTLRNSFLKV